MEDSTISELKAKYPGEALMLFSLSSGEEMVVKNPGRPAYMAFKAALPDVQKRPMALEQLVLSAVVFPSRPEVAALFEKRPAMAEVMGSKVLEVLGADLSVEKKDL